MRSTLVILSVLAVAFVTASLGDLHEDGDDFVLNNGNNQVKTLTEATFEHDTQAGSGFTTGDWFVMFGVASCPHCTAAKAEWHNLAKNFGKHKTLIAEVDCDASYWVCSRFTIRSYPTFYLFKQGTYYAYTGIRSADLFQQWLAGPYAENKVGPVPPELAGAAKLTAMAAELGKDFEQIAKTMPLLAYGALGMVVVLSVLLLVLCLCTGTAPAPKRGPI